MTSLESKLDVHGKPITPSVCLAVGLDPTRIADLIRDSMQRDAVCLPAACGET